MSTGDRHKIDIFFLIIYLHFIYGTTRIDRWNNEEARRKVAVREKLIDRAVRKGWRSFGHKEQMSE